MENFALISLIEQLRLSTDEIVIRRVLQHQPNGFIFQTRSRRFPALKVILDPQNPAFYASDSRPPMEAPASDFLMVLRKHLTSAELTSITKALSERVVELAFKTAVPSRELENMILVIELLPNAPNVILLDAQRRVLASFLPLTPQHGMSEYEIYRFPNVTGKSDMEQLIAGHARGFDSAEFDKNPQQWLIGHVAGIGPVLASEIVHRHRQHQQSVPEETHKLIEEIRQPSHAAWIYTDLPLGFILEQNDLRRFVKAIISPIELHHLSRSYSSRQFANILEAAKFYFDEVESRTLLERAKIPLLHDLHRDAKRLTQREERFVGQLRKFEEAEGLQRTAQLLVSSGMKMDQHHEVVEVDDYFSEKPEKRRIALDSSISLRENAGKMFKRHQKAVRGKQIVERQMAEIRDRRSAVQDQLRRLRAIKDWDTWLAVAGRFEAERETRNVPPGRIASRRRYRSLQIDGREVFVGRNSRENDALTFRVATPDDFWFHVADYTGSHVIVRNPLREKELDEGVLVKAAQLAAYFSQARNSTKVGVHYTKRKHVTKPKRAKPGLVRLMEFRSITVEPKNWLEGGAES